MTFFRRKPQVAPPPSPMPEELSAEKKRHQQEVDKHRREQHDNIIRLRKLQAEVEVERGARRAR